MRVSTPAKNGLASANLIENSRKAFLDMRKMRSSMRRKPALLNTFISKVACFHSLKILSTKEGQRGILKANGSHWHHLREGEVVFLSSRHTVRLKDGEGEEQLSM